MATHRKVTFVIPEQSRKVVVTTKDGDPKDGYSATVASSKATGVVGKKRITVSPTGGNGPIEIREEGGDIYLY